MDKDVNVSAVFGKNAYTITVSQNTGGTVFVEAEDLTATLMEFRFTTAQKLQLKLNEVIALRLVGRRYSNRA